MAETYLTHFNSDVVTAVKVLWGWDINDGRENVLV